MADGGKIYLYHPVYLSAGQWGRRDRDGVPVVPQDVTKTSETKQVNIGNAAIAVVGTKDQIIDALKWSNLVVTTHQIEIPTHIALRISKVKKRGSKKGSKIIAKLIAWDAIVDALRQAASAVVQARDLKASHKQFYLTIDSKLSGGTRIHGGYFTGADIAGHAEALFANPDYKPASMSSSSSSSASPSSDGMPGPASRSASSSDSSSSSSSGSGSGSGSS